MTPIVPSSFADPRWTSACYRTAGRSCWKRTGLLALLVVLFLGIGAGSEVRAQIGVAPQPRFQIGLAGLPGGGTQVGYITARSFFTTESVFYAEGTPPALGRGALQVSAGFGGAVRLFALSRLLGTTARYANRFDVDLGLRLGPSLAFAEGETTADENKRFSLFLEPFLRVAPSLGETWALFVETGTQRPYVRAGALWDF